MKMPMGASFAGRRSRTPATTMERSTVVRFAARGSRTPTRRWQTVGMRCEKTGRMRSLGETFVVRGNRTTERMVWREMLGANKRCLERISRDLRGCGLQMD